MLKSTVTRIGVLRTGIDVGLNSKTGNGKPAAKNGACIVYAPGTESARQEKASVFQTESAGGACIVSDPGIENTRQMNGRPTDARAPEALASCPKDTGRNAIEPCNLLHGPRNAIEPRNLLRCRLKPKADFSRPFGVF